LDLLYIVMNSNASVADRIAPIHKLFRYQRSQVAEPSRGCSKLVDQIQPTRQSVRRRDVRGVCINAPVGSKPRVWLGLSSLKAGRRFIPANEITPPERAHLIVGHIKDVLQLPD